MSLSPLATHVSVPSVLAEHSWASHCTPPNSELAVWTDGKKNCVYWVPGSLGPPIIARLLPSARVRVQPAWSLKLRPENGSIAVNATKKPEPMVLLRARKLPSAASLLPKACKANVSVKSGQGIVRVLVALVEVLEVPVLLGLLVKEVIYPSQRITEL